MKKKCEYIERYVNDLYRFSMEHPDELMPPTTDPQFALECLKECFLGADWYTPNPISTLQCNTEILCSILRKYSPEYRRLINNRTRKKRRQLRDTVKYVLFILCASLGAGGICAGVLYTIDWFVKNIWP